MCNTYEGLDVACTIVDGEEWTITESSIRPKGARFEASRRDGSKSEFASTLEDLVQHLIDEYTPPTLDEWLGSGIN